MLDCVIRSGWPRLLWAMPIVLPTIAGCTVPIGGVTGISVDGKGEPVAVLAVCEGEIDGLSLYIGDGEQSRDVGTWKASAKIKRYAELSMSEPAEGWSTETPLPPLENGVTYKAYGWTEGNDWSTASVSFKLSDLRDLQPVQVQYEAYDETTDDFKQIRVDRTEFRTRACADVGK